MSWYDNKILEFGQTCPDIDKSINDFKQDIKVYLEEIEWCVKKGEPVALDIYNNDIYKAFESYFEKVRQTNSDLRDAAEGQLKDLTDELAEAKETISQLEYKIHDLEN